jgi:PAS domain S-box-containing protein
MRNLLGIKKSNNLWSSLPVSYRGAIVIAIPAICLVATLGAWVWSLQARATINRQIDRQQRIVVQTNNLLVSLIDAETGVRGYNVSREERYLDPYKKAIYDIHPRLARLEQNLRTDPQQLQRLEEIKQLVKEQNDVLKQTIALVEKRGGDDVHSTQELALLDRGKKVMDSIRQLLATLEAKEQSLLEINQQHFDEVGTLTISIQWVAAFASAISYVGAVYLFDRLAMELQERERQLKESKTVIEAIATNIIDGVATMTRDGNIETFNRAASEMFGYEPAEIIGRDWSVLLVEPTLVEREKIVQSQVWRERLRQSERIWQKMGYRKTGEHFPIEISISRMDIDNRWLVIIRDVSERLEAISRLTKLSAILTKTNIALQKQNQELDKFAYVASHDLKAPLRAIASLSEWIEEDLEGQLPEENQHQMQLLRGRVHRLEALINGLLTYSRVGRMNAPVRLVDVMQLLQEIIDSLQLPRGFIVEIEMKMPVFETKKELLQQVFVQLIENAIAHNDRPEAHIQISVRDRDRFYEFALADDGPGISPQFHERIFVIFQTLFPRDVKESTGIGLALVKKIVELQGGQVWLKAQEGAGATFYFTWPKSSLIHEELPAIDEHLTTNSQIFSYKQ